MANKINSDLFLGVQTSIELDRPPAVPRKIRAIRDRALRERATAAWKAALQLERVIRLWGHFKILGLHGQRLDRASEARVKKFYPALEKLCGVLDVFAPQERTPAQESEVLKEQEKMSGIVRRPTNDYSAVERKQLMRPGTLYGLVEAFRRLLESNGRALYLAGVKSGFFGRTERDVVNALTLITKINIDFTGDNPPVDFAAPWDKESIKAMAGAIGALQRIKTMLEDFPESLLTSLTPKGNPRFEVRLRPPECNLDDKFYPLDRQAAAMLDALVALGPNWVSSDRIKAKYPILLAGRDHLNRVVEQMPPNVQVIVKAKPGKGGGWRIELPL
jgi:hypothetical protein